jgi:hypothetical protein
MRRASFLIIVVVLALAQIGLAQDSTSDCPTFVQTVFDDLANSCAIPERASTCYGYPNVQATNVGGVATPNFSKPSDRADVLGLESLTTSAFDLGKKIWGIAVTDVQANLPVGLAGQGGVIVSLGDVRLENGVSPQEALQLPMNPLVVATAADNTQLFDLPPDFLQSVVGTVPSGTLLQADGISPDKQWLRVYFEYERDLGIAPTAWVSLASLQPTVNTSVLPVMTPTSYTSMQRFYLTNGTDDPPCAEIAPSSIYVQGPEEIQMDLTINNAPIRVSSSALVRILPPGDVMQVIALTGIIVLGADSTTPVLLPPGFFSNICLVPDSAGHMIMGNCPWSAPDIVDNLFLTRLFTALNRRIPQNLLYYPSGVPRQVCVSGVGGPICVLVAPFFEERLRRTCRLRLLPQQECQPYGFPWGR